MVLCNLTISSEKLFEGIDAVSFLAEAGIMPSKGESRKMIQNGGIQINRRKIDNIHFTVDQSYLLHGKYLLVQKGKKNYSFLGEIGLIF